jgi:hypothetical protein
MMGHRTFGLYKSYSLRRCTYVFENTRKPKAFPQQKDTVFAKDSTHSTVYDVVPFLTLQGIDQLYQQCGVTYYYRGIGPAACEDTSKKGPPIIRKWVWFTPSNANKIKGVNIGLLTKTSTEERLPSTAQTSMQTCLRYSSAFMLCSPSGPPVP